MTRTAAADAGLSVTRMDSDGVSRPPLTRAGPEGNGRPRPGIRSPTGPSGAISFWNRVDPVGRPARKGRPRPARTARTGQKRISATRLGPAGRVTWRAQEPVGPGSSRRVIDHCSIQVADNGPDSPLGRDCRRDTPPGPWSPVLPWAARPLRCTCASVAAGRPT